MPFHFFSALHLMRFLICFPVETSKEFKILRICGIALQYLVLIICNSVLQGTLQFTQNSDTIFPKVLKNKVTLNFAAPLDVETETPHWLLTSSMTINCRWMQISTGCHGRRSLVRSAVSPSPLKTRSKSFCQLRAHAPRTIAFCTRT